MHILSSLGNRVSLCEFASLSCLGISTLLYLLVNSVQYSCTCPDDFCNFVFGSGIEYSICPDVFVLDSGMEQMGLEMHASCPLFKVATSQSWKISLWIFLPLWLVEKFSKRLFVGENATASTLDAFLP